MGELIEYMGRADLSPLYISLRTGAAATVIAFFLGLFCARKVVKAGPWTRAVADGFLTLPLVLPPTVAGFLLLLLFSPRRPLGSLLYRTFHIRAVQTPLACVLAAAVVSFPLMYRNARAAMEQVDEDLVSAARTLGMSETRIFWRVIIPVAQPGILSGTVLTFARALGEYGATAMLAGNIPGRTSTISQKIAMVVEDGDYASAGFWTLVIVIIAFVIVVALNLLSGDRSARTERMRGREPAEGGIEDGA